MVASPMQVVDTSAPARAPALAPQRKIVFESEGFGTFEAWYHEVLIEGRSLILLYNNAHQGGHKYFPPQNSDKDLAVFIEGHSLLYLVQATGVKYSFNGYEHCVMMIIREEQHPQAAQPSHSRMQSNDLFQAQFA